MKHALKNRWIKAGLLLALIGWGPLIGIIALAAIGVWPDPNPNPIGPGLLFFFTFWPAMICLGIGLHQLSRGPDATTLAFQDEIIKTATSKLGRALSEKEERFVRSRGGYVALEAILDTVRSGSAPDVEKYLNSEG